MALFDSFLKRYADRPFIVPDREENPAPFRFLNPPTAAQIMLPVAAAVALFVFSANTEAAPSKKKKSNLPCDPSPYKYDRALVRETAQEYINTGVKDVDVVANNVATDLYGTHPSGTKVVFPPTTSGLKGVACVWQLVNEDVVDIFKDNGIVDDFEPTPDGNTPVDWLPINPIEDIDTYPWEMAVVDINDYPTPSAFLRVKKGNNYDTIIRNALNSAIAMADAAGYDVTKVRDAMKGNNQLSRNLKRDYRRAVVCSEWNDSAYGQTDKGKGGIGENVESYINNPKGRTINMLPSHADNGMRIAQGKPALRGTRLDGTKLPGIGSNYMLLWMPALDLSALGGVQPSIRMLKWSDGSSTINPPPVVMSLGVDMNGISLPGGAGCEI